MWLRLQPLAVGQRYDVPVALRDARSSRSSPRWSGASGSRRRRARFAALKVKVRTALEGKFSTKRDSWMWLSDDPRHVLVRAAADFAVGQHRRGAEAGTRRAARVTVASAEVEAARPGRVSRLLGAAPRRNFAAMRAALLAPPRRLLRLRARAGARRPERPQAGRARRDRRRERAREAPARRPGARARAIDARGRARRVRVGPDRGPRGPAAARRSPPRRAPLARARRACRSRSTASRRVRSPRGVRPRRRARRVAGPARPRARRRSSARRAARSRSRSAPGRLQAIWVEVCVPARRAGRATTRGEVAAARRRARARDASRCGSACGRSRCPSTRHLRRRVRPPHPRSARARSGSPTIRSSRARSRRPRSRHRVTPYVLSADPPDGALHRARAARSTGRAIDAEVGPVLDGELVPGVKGDVRRGADLREGLGRAGGGPRGDAARMEAPLRGARLGATGCGSTRSTSRGPSSSRSSAGGRASRARRASACSRPSCPPRRSPAPWTRSRRTSRSLPDRARRARSACRSPTRRACRTAATRSRRRGRSARTMLREFARLARLRDRPPRHRRARGALARLAPRPRRASSTTTCSSRGSRRSLEGRARVRGERRRNAALPGPAGGARRRARPFPVESIRLKIIRDALEDLELLRLAEAAGLGALAQATAGEARARRRAAFERDAAALARGARGARRSRSRAGTARGGCADGEAGVIAALASLALGAGAAVRRGAGCLPSPTAERPWRTGETLELELDVLGVVKAGTLQLSVERPMSGGQIVPLRARAEDDAMRREHRKRSPAWGSRGSTRARSCPSATATRRTRTGVRKTSDTRIPAGAERITIDLPAAASARARPRTRRAGEVLDALSARLLPARRAARARRPLCFDLVAKPALLAPRGDRRARQTEEVETPAGKFETLRVDAVARRADRPDRRARSPLAHDRRARLLVAAVSEVDLGPVRAMLVRARREAP